MKKWILRGFALLLCTVLLCGCALPGRPAAEPEPSPEPTPTPEPLPSFPPDAPLYETTVGMTNCFSEPSADEAGFLGVIPEGVQAAFLREEGEFSLLMLPGGMEVWVSSWMVDPVDEGLKKKRDDLYLKARLGREGYMDFESRPVYTCASQGLACRTYPGEDAQLVYTLSAGSHVTVFGREGDYYLCRLPNDRLAYCPVRYLYVADSYRTLNGAVDLRVFLPEAEFELLFATRNNITGEAMYPPIPMMEEQTAAHLKTAYDRFRADGYTIKVYDAYRPKSAQYKLYDIVRNNWFISNPYNGNSWHQLGRAIDMSLIDLKTGQELLMPTPMHTFSNDAARFNSKLWSEQVKNNVDYMTQVMLESGFTLLSTEWWHFQYEGAGGSLPIDMDLNELAEHPIWEYDIDGDRAGEQQ